MLLSLIFDMHQIITETIEPVRPGRKYPGGSIKETDIFIFVTSQLGKVDDIE